MSKRRCQYYSFASCWDRERTHSQHSYEKTKSTAINKAIGLRQGVMLYMVVKANSLKTNFVLYKLIWLLLCLGDAEICMQQCWSWVWVPDSCNIIQLCPWKLSFFYSGCKLSMESAPAEVHRNGTAVLKEVMFIYCLLTDRSLKVKCVISAPHGIAKNNDLIQNSILASLYLFAK